jgi:hypothetical protein
MIQARDEQRPKGEKHEGFADHKRVQGQKLKIRWDALRSDRSRFLFKTKNQTRINDLSADPRVVGATLTIRGTGLTDGDTGVIHLIDGPEGRWSPIGDKGWQYKYGHDFNDSYGITNVKMKENVKKGGSLIIKGKGQFFDYDIFDAQDTVDVSLSIGIDVYCAQFGQNQGELVRNEMGKVDGKSSDPPMTATRSITTRARTTVPAVCRKTSNSTARSKAFRR